MIVSEETETERSLMTKNVCQVFIGLDASNSTTKITTPQVCPFNFCETVTVKRKKVLTDHSVFSILYK